MGFFSWCTSDTKKSIAVWMDGYEDCPKKVYLLNPFGKPYEEEFYDGYGHFGGRDVYALVALWNVPELCKGRDGKILSDSNLRNIGIDIACGKNKNAYLKYPIKIVEKPVPYEEAGISPECPFQGYFYGSKRQRKLEVKHEFEKLAKIEKEKKNGQTIEISN